VAGTLPEGDVIAILLDQHARIRELFADVRSATGEHKQQAFDELRALLAVHETGEEMILRPEAAKAAGRREADARNSEENEANHVLARLEELDVHSAEFDAMIAAFERDVDRHARAEETEEFPAILQACDQRRREKMGSRLRLAEKVAPTHPHPGAAGSPAKQWTVGPFASLVDRAKDALRTED
jgi:hypothetical protein